jgi:superfamily II DNA helicase RecQ
MEDFEEIFQHFPQYQIIVCKACRYAPIPKHVKGHLQKSHKTISSEKQHRIVDVVNNLPNIAQRPEDVRYPHEEADPIPHLPVFADGYQCRWKDRSGQLCQYVCRGKKRWGIQRHCRTEHHWRNWQEQGGRADDRQKQTPNKLWVESQSCQRFFKIVEWQRYFVVKVETSNNPATNVETTEAQADDIFIQYQQAITEAKTQRAVEGDSSRSVANAWLSFTGWAGHMSQFKGKEQTQAFIQPKVDGDQTEKNLEDACRGTRRLVRRAFATCNPSTVSKAALESVNRRETGAGTNERPFYAGQQVKTIRKYSDSWVHIMRYLWRTAFEKERPKYKWTERQSQSMRHLQTITSDRSGTQHARREAIEEACFTFWIAMFDHELKDSEFDSGIMSGLAVLGIDTQTGTWKSALSYTPILSAIVAVMRALVVYRAWKIRQKSIQEGVTGGMSLEEAADQARSVVDGVDRLTERFMTLREFGGRISPMDRILRTRTYGLKIRMTTKASGTVAWEGDRVLVNKIRFGIDDIRTVVHGLFEDVSQRFKNELMLADEDQVIPQLDISSLADNAAELSEGWSFLHDSRNEFPIDGERWMWRRMFAEEKIQQKLLTGEIGQVERREDIQWNRKGVEDYFRTYRRFKEECAVLVHLTAGSPARATELTSIQIENGPEGRGQRGVFIDNGMVDFVTAYHKGWSASKKSKVIHRFVPREVGQLIVQSMWLLEPWIRQLQNMVHSQTEFSPFIWEPKPEEDWKTGEDEDEGQEDDDDNREESRDDDEWSDDGREAPPQARNVDGFWDTDRVRRVMQRETRKRIGVGIGVSDWRHAYPAIQREHTKDHSVREALDCIYDNRAPQIRRMEDVVAEQAGHSRYMEDMIYGLLLTESPTATLSERNMFRKVSIDWHRFLRFRSAWEEQSTVDPVVQRQLDSERSQAQFRRWKQMRTVDVEAQAKRLYGAEAMFRGVQKPALDAIISGQPRMLVVMRTGGGKSWLFMLPAAGSIDGVSIVIVPTISLRQDMMDRCNRDGIPCAQWNGSRPPYHARIVLVTPESAVSQAFGRFVDEKRTTYQLERIVIDECHTILESTAEWRPKVLDLCQMAEKGVQVLYLTATLPPRTEPAFFDTIGVPEGDLRIFRDNTSRPRIEYNVVEYDRDDEDVAVRRIVEGKKEQFPTPGQIIVYCKKIDQARRLAKVLQCSVYHRTVGTDEEKKGILRRLTGQKDRVFTATNALGLGIDAPTIRAVIHVGIRDSLAQYAQESGRAGRDGVSSEATMMRARWRDHNGQERVEEGWRAEPAMKEFLGGHTCRRIALDKHMDGRQDRTGCESGESRCDVCRGRPRGTKRRRTVANNDEEPNESSKVARTDVGMIEERAYAEFEEERQTYEKMEEQRRCRTIGREDAVHQLRRQFESWSGRCVICRIQGRDGEDHMDWRECPHGDVERPTTQKAWDWLGGIRFEPYSQCWGCWAAQAVCHSWQDVSHGGPQRFRRSGKQWTCQFTGVLQDVTAAVLAVGEGEMVGEWIDGEMAKTGMEQSEGEEDWTRRRRWMGRKVRMGGLEMSGLCQILWELG